MRGRRLYFLMKRDYIRDGLRKLSMAIRQDFVDRPWPGPLGWISMNLRRLEFLEIESTHFRIIPRVDLPPPPSLLKLSLR